MGPEDTGYMEVSNIQRLFYMYDNLSGTIKMVCYREVSTIQGVFSKRFCVGFDTSRASTSTVELG